MQFKEILALPSLVPALLSALPLLLAAKKPPPTSFNALVIKLDGSTLLLSAADGNHFKQVAVQTNDKTQVLIEGNPGALTDLKPGQRVIVSPPSGTAAKIEEKAPRNGKTPESGLIDGAVVSADAGHVQFYTPASSGQIDQVQIATGDKTVVMIDGKSATAADLKPGQYIEVAFIGGNVRRIVVQAMEAK